MFSNENLMLAMLLQMIVLAILHIFDPAEVRKCAIYY